MPGDPVTVRAGPVPVNSPPVGGSSSGALMEHLVRHAVTTIRERFWEPLSLEELARGAMVSKYHFLRVFTRVTGVTPGRFLCAVRLQEAKVLLLSTQLTVADI